MVSKIDRGRTVEGAKSELFAAYRYHPCFTDRAMTLVQTESQHRGHAIIERVHADLKNGSARLLFG